MPSRLPEIKVTPITPSAGSKVDYGAIVTGLDLKNLDDASFKALEDAIYTHKVVVVKDQQDLVPLKQFELIHRFDPDTKPVHGFGDPDAYKDNEFVKLVVPNSGGVRLVGKGYHGPDHYGLKDLIVPTVNDYNKLHGSNLDPEEFASGQTRFFTLRCIQAPKGPDLTVRWDNGSGLTMKTKPGETAFVSGVQLHNLLSPEDQMLADHSRRELAPHPYTWKGTRKYRSTGMGLEKGGEVLPLDKLPAWTPDKVHTYPMIWVDERTGEKASQIMPTCVRKLHLRTSFDEKERVVEDLEEIRLLLNGWMDKILRPEYICFPPVEDGDVAMWNNYIWSSNIDREEAYIPLWKNPPVPRHTSISFIFSSEASD
ncbi:Clavaminate synthase-like protein [Mollisia scopiformis]|uniref:Clavaminate synthase-like protein n=1 Tax=Mollisia scopiformis TaxID=149040 RepID=A0A132B5P9_MOLSC|nr:Clavaminate synthase-like protein [Mollisia scopiformis]KUJ07214.1 Clavaminate synthase-like protein [Mollisia scopiformis]